MASDVCDGRTDLVSASPAAIIHQPRDRCIERAGKAALQPAQDQVP